VRGGYGRQQGFFSPGHERFRVTREQVAERLSRLPLRVLRREGLHAVERELELEVNRLLGPERAVVVERGDPFRRGHEVLPAGRRDTPDEAYDRAFGRPVVPRRQRVARRRSDAHKGRRQAGHKNSTGCDDPKCCPHVDPARQTPVLYSLQEWVDRSG
jgi:hypothetical protein